MERKRGRGWLVALLAWGAVGEGWKQAGGRDELKPRDYWWTAVEREEGGQRRSGEVEMEDGGQPAVVECRGSTVTVERGIGIWRWVEFGNDATGDPWVKKTTKHFFYQTNDRRRHTDSWAVRTIAAHGNGGVRSDTPDTNISDKNILTSDTRLRGKTTRSILTLFLVNPESLKWTNAHIAQVQD